MSLLVPAVFLDFRYGKIPNWLNGIGILTGFAYGLSVKGVSCLPERAAGVVLPVFILILLFYFHWLGGGDIKLFSMLGSFFGFQVLQIMVYAFLFGAGQSVMLLLFHRKRETADRRKLHFSLSIFAGALYFLLKYNMGRGGMF